MGTMTVGELRKLIADLPDETAIGVDVELDIGDTLNVPLTDATVEARCDDVMCLFLTVFENDEERAEYTYAKDRKGPR